MARCAKCAALAREVEDFDARIHDAAMVPVPEALADRVLLRHKVREPARFGGFGFGIWALAASLIIAIGVVIHLHRADIGDEERIATSAAVGEGHAAIAAISYVLDHEPQLLKENVSGDPAVMRSALMRLGLKLPAKGTTVRYLGKCPVPSGEGEHLVLQTPFGQVTLILVPEQSLGPRVVVAYRDRTAAVSPLRSGSYIVVADSLRAVKQLEQMLM
ncbi:MAG: hypothetical protein A3F74_17325 [Betaproteobacteria bacterium RIFCSPLOWO2_12_FULL_62_58]|nr:MAG: hypothetical protein A3F74_17325 [Betaproteobacteria bacterium RIFCSPLOWO2_12_FULL_62_58]